MAMNVGSVDRAIRVFAGLVLILWSISWGRMGLGMMPGFGLWHWSGLAVGIVLLVTGLAGRCLIYRWTGIDTSKAD